MTTLVPALGVRSAGGRISSRRRAGWRTYLVLAVAVMGAYALVRPEVRTYLYPAWTFTSFIAIAVGIRRNRPERAYVMWLFGLGVLSDVLADVFFVGYGLVRHVDTPYPSFADVLYLSSFVWWALAIGLLIGARRAGRDLAGWIDTAIVVVAFALLEFVFLVYPFLTSANETLSSRVVSALYPIADILVLGLFARLLVSPGSHTAAFRFLVAGFVLQLGADSAYGILSTASAYSEGLLDLGWMGAYAMFAAAALHPSVRTLVTDSDDERPQLTKRRVMVLASVTLVAPALFAKMAGSTPAPPVVTAVAVGAAVMFLLVVSRLVGLASALATSMRATERAQALRGELLRRTIETTEDERARLARELHDGPVQHLSGLSYTIEATRSRAARGEAVADRLDEVGHALGAEISSLRRMMTALRPGSLVERGLEATLADSIAAACDGSPLTWELDVAMDDRPTAHVETVLYRVAQEAVSNVLAHARARHLRVALRATGDAVELTVGDDGVGFQAEAVSGDWAHLGLAGMRERLEMIDGALTIDTHPDAGTTVIARVPTTHVLRPPTERRSV